jgi:hypothetical protein
MKQSGHGEQNARGDSPKEQRVILQILLWIEALQLGLDMGCELARRIANLRPRTSPTHSIHG